MSEVFDEGRNERQRESDTDSIPSSDGCSIVSGEEDEVTFSPELREGQIAFSGMDEIDVGTEFRRRASVMKTVPVFLKVPFRQAVKAVLDEICCGMDVGDPIRHSRGGWKVLLMLPRMLLHRPARLVVQADRSRPTMR